MISFKYTIWSLFAAHTFNACPLPTTNNRIRPSSTVAIRGLLMAGLMACLSAPASYAQVDQEGERTARNAVFVEVGGNGGLYSLNVERLVLPRFSLRGGVSTLGFMRTTEYVILPATASLLIQQADPKYHFELGGGPSFVIDQGIADILGTAILGLRYQPVDGGLFLRLAFTPLLSTSGEIELLWGHVGPSAGFAIGYSF